MYNRNTTLVFSTLALIALLAAATVPIDSSESSATEIDVHSSNISIVYDNSETVKIRANESASFSFHIHNSGETPESVTVTASVNGNINVKPESDLELIQQKNALRVDMALHAEKSCPSGDYNLKITVKVLTKDDTSADITVPVHVPSTSADSTVPVHVPFSFSSDGHNKFLGWLNNDLEAPFNGVWFTAAVSAVGFLLIGYAIMFVATHVCAKIAIRRDNLMRANLRKLLYRLCQAIIWLWAIEQTLRIIGTSEESIDIINKLFCVAYVIAGLIVGWHVYKMAIGFLARNARDRNHDDAAGVDIESFKPLFLYIGEIVIAVVGTMLIMSLFGFDLTAIVTSAGLVSLGISMGAQDVLKQFFAGLEILATRPFRRGDLIVVGTNPTVFKVRRVNVMNTLLENWDNTDVNIMPNSMIVTNNIKNLTRDTVITKVYVTAEVAYGTDVNLARGLMQEVANNNHHVITDGSVTRPYTRLEAFGNSNLAIKMGLYVDDYNTHHTVMGQIRQDIVDAFNRHGISIDYTQVVVHQGGPLERNASACAEPNTDKL